MGQIRRDLPNDEYQAAVGANNASAANVFATIADLSGGGTGDADRVIFDAKYDQVGGIIKGQAVYVSGADGTNITVSKADYSTEATSSKTLGLVVLSGANNFQGQVISDGLLDGLNTSAAGAAGDPVWLGDDGNLIYGLLNKPYAPNHLVFIGIVTRKNASNGEIFVKVQNGFELDEIHNVDVKSSLPTDGQVLTYDSVTGLWRNETPLVGSDVTLTSAGGSQSLVNDGTGPSLAVKGLTAGGGILLLPSVGNDFISIVNTSPATGVTLTSAGGTETLVNDGTGPALATKGVNAGTGISLSSTATDLTVTNSAPDQVVALTAGTGIGITGTYPNFTVSNTGALSNVNIYNSDGSIPLGGRNLNLNGQALAFQDITANGQFSVNMDDGSTKGVDFVVNKAFNSWDNFDNVTGEGSGITITPQYTQLQAVDPIAGVTRNLQVNSSGVQINAQYTLPNGAGSAGQVITSTILGQTAFQPLPAEVQAAASDETTNLTTGTAKVTFRMPHRMTLTAVRASLTTAQTAGSLLTVDINLNGSSVLGTKLTFDNNERTTVTAATPATIVTSDLIDDGEITVDIDVVGTAGAKGLKITLIGTRA